MVNEHVLSWVIAFGLFFVAVGLHKAGKQKGLKIVQMILRLFYILIIASGAMILLSLNSISFMYILKAAVGIWVISMLELILVRMTKQQSTGFYWVQFAISFAVILYLGLRLPLGMYYFL